MDREGENKENEGQEGQKKTTNSLRQSVNFLKQIASLKERAVEDQSLARYRKSLMEDGQLHESLVPEIELVYLDVIRKGKVLQRFSDMGKMRIILSQNKCYEFQIGFYVHKSFIIGLKFVNSVYKSIIKLETQQFSQGTYAPSKNVQTANLVFQTPGGVFGRGNYTGLAKAMDRDKRTYMSLNYEIEVV